MKDSMSGYLLRGFVVHNVFLLFCIWKTTAVCSYDPPVVPGRGSCSTDTYMSSAETLPNCKVTCLAEAACVAFSYNGIVSRCTRHTCLTAAAGNTNYEYYVKQCKNPGLVMPDTPETTTTTPETTTTALETTTSPPETTTTTPETTTSSPPTTTTTPEMTTTTTQLMTTITTLSTTEIATEMTTHAKESSTGLQSRELSSMWIERMSDCVVDTDVIFLRFDVTLVACTATCSINSSCVAVFFDFLARSCQGHPYTYSPLSPGIRVKLGTAHFIRNY